MWTKQELSEGDNLRQGSRPDYRTDQKQMLPKSDVVAVSRHSLTLFLSPSSGISLSRAYVGYTVQSCMPRLGYILCSAALLHARNVAPSPPPPPSALFKHIFFVGCVRVLCSGEPRRLVCRLRHHRRRCRLLDHQELLGLRVSVPSVCVFLCRCSRLFEKSTELEDQRCP